MLVLEIAAVLVFVVFLTLKLTRNIDWSWWKVTSPLWGVLVLELALLMAAAFMDGFINGLA